MPIKDPETRRAYMREYRAKNKPGASQPPGGIPETAANPVPLRTPDDVIAIVEEQVNAVRADQESGVQLRARTVAYLLSVGLKALEAGDVAKMLAELQTRLDAMENGRAG